jgi:chloramphenicol-sensitive protein RarD
VTTVLIASNWFMYIWAVANGRVIESSLGYFINPLVSVGLGVVFLKERLSRVAMACVVLAGLGVLVLATRGDGIPWIALALAFSFAVYGLVRKVVAVDAITGLTIETGVLLPLAASFLVWQGIRGSSAFLAGDARVDLLLVVAGPVTMGPLLGFAIAARRLRLATIGFMQYLSPTCQLLLAVFAYGEIFTLTHAIGFGCIWVALAAYSIDLAGQRRRRRRLPSPSRDRPFEQIVPRASGQRDETAF